MRTELSLTALARSGFTGLSEVRERLAELHDLTSLGAEATLPMFAAAADPDAALERLLALLRTSPSPVRAFLDDADAAGRLVRVLGASDGLSDFLLRHPDALDVLREPIIALPDGATLVRDLLSAVGAVDGMASAVEESAWSALRVRYRTWLLRVASFDLEQRDPVGGLDRVSAALAALAGAALEASLAVARAQTSGKGPGRYPAEEVRATRLAIIGMGKAGARELNYVSDVDVIYVAEGDEESGLSNPRAVDIATRLAMLTARGIDAPALEPGLWELDANLRPEGKDGALVRTLASHVTYYERWAKSWEFQALLKARAMAGDAELGERYCAAVAPFVWESSARENFVESVQRMRERVTDNIPDDELDHQLKLGPGGLRDIEFTVQLLQLVHGRTDAAVRVAGTLPALESLAAQGYIGRSESAQFAADYRVLRLLEHRLQLDGLRRTHLMPRDEHRLRVLARASGLASTADGLLSRWQEVKQRVRGLHERLFYRPLLAAVAGLRGAERVVPGEEQALTSEQAEARLAAIGFVDPHGALAHIAALTSGVSRRATIQRHLLPVMLQWFADGADPDYGLLTFRRLSEDLGSTHWFLRMLRDSSGAAERLTRVLSGSRFVGELVGRIPEAVAWLDDDDDLRPRAPEVLREEARAILLRHADEARAATALRSMRRREVLRLAFSAILGLCTVEELGHALADVTETLLDAVLTLVRRGESLRGEFAIIAMGRFGGRELGFGSDADVLYVFRAAEGADAGEEHSAALRIASGLVRLTEDQVLPLDLDIGLRPEGKNGPPVRSLQSYRAYYERWSLTWEAQALLRARPVAGDAALRADFTALADAVRYPETLADRDVREVKRIKARVENERLPQGADPSRHLKLGRGSLSDVEWLVQLVQLENGASVAELRTASTLDALAAAVAHGLIESDDAELLRAAWVIASRARSAMTLWTNKTSDVLPVDRRQLEGVARMLEYPAGSANRLEQDYLGITRRARSVFDRLFYGVDEKPTPTTG
jgi:glutamate-ammonia-ligase adenylyltransferase